MANKKFRLIVVGDEMQLPPTTFFASARTEDETVVVEEEGERGCGGGAAAAAAAAIENFGRVSDNMMRASCRNSNNRKACEALAICCGCLLHFENKTRRVDVKS